MRRTRIAIIATVLAAVLVAGIPTVASALSTGTTGASGHISTPAANDPDHARCADDICLWATDTLTDGWCVRWQREADTAPFTWSWYGAASCNGVENLVATNAPNGVYRLCRLHFNNCGPDFSVWF